MSEPVAQIRYSGEAEVRAFRRGTYLGLDHLDTSIERALGSRYHFGGGWKGYAVVSISLYDEPPEPERGRGSAASGAAQTGSGSGRRGRPPQGVTARSASP